MGQICWLPTQYPFPPSLLTTKYLILMNSNSPSYNLLVSFDNRNGKWDGQKLLDTVVLEKFFKGADSNWRCVPLRWLKLQKPSRTIRLLEDLRYGWNKTRRTHSWWLGSNHTNEGLPFPLDFFNPEEKSISTLIELLFFGILFNNQV